MAITIPVTLDIAFKDTLKQVHTIGELKASQCVLRVAGNDCIIRDVMGNDSPGTALESRFPDLLLEELASGKKFEFTHQERYRMINELKPSEKVSGHLLSLAKLPSKLKSYCTQVYSTTMEGQLRLWIASTTCDESSTGEIHSMGPLVNPVLWNGAGCQLSMGGGIDGAEYFLSPICTRLVCTKSCNRTTMGGDWHCVCQ